jgi:hypothetical protein
LSFERIKGETPPAEVTPDFPSDPDVCGEEEDLGPFHNFNLPLDRFISSSDSGQAGHITSLDQIIHDIYNR